MRGKIVLSAIPTTMLFIAATALGQDGQTTGQKTITKDPFSGKVRLTSPRVQQVSPPEVPAPAVYSTPTVYSTPAVYSTPVLPASKVTPAPLAPTVYLTEMPENAGLTTASSAGAAHGNIWSHVRQGGSPTAIKLAIEVNNQWGTTVSTEQRTYHTGEKIRLRITSPLDGQIDIVQRAPDGSVRTLYPESKYRDRIWVRADMETVIPGGGDCFKFDQPEGDITLFITITGTTPAPSERQRTDEKLIAMSTESGSKSLTRVHVDTPWMLLFSAEPKAATLSLEVKLHQER